MQKDIFLRIGDKVRIKSKKWFDECKTTTKFHNYVEDNDYEYIFTEEMAEHCGKFGTVISMSKENNNEIYYLLDIGPEYFWQNYMFEDHSVISKEIYPIKFGEFYVIYDETNKEVIDIEFYLTKEDAEDKIIESRRQSQDQI